MGLFSLTQELAIDLGTANTLIVYNDEVVVDEPSVVAVIVTLLIYAISTAFAMPNKDDLGIVIDDNGLNLLDISTGEYLNINKYRHICTNYVKDLNKHIFKYKVNICRVYNPRNCIKRYESRLEIVAPKIYNEIHNIYNVNSEYEIKCILNKLQNELDCKGIYVNLEEANIRSLEINKTFEWENSILEDEDILDYIFKVIKGSDVYNKNFDVNKRVVKVYKESVTYSISSNRIKMKIYSKSEQVLNTIGYNCRVPLCRIELTLSKSAIKSSYGTDNISILKDSVKREEVFLKNISSKLINPLINNFNKEIDIIMDKLRRYDRCNYRNLDLLYKSISNELFDIVLLGVAASTIYKDRGNNNFKRDFKRLLGHISKEHIGRYQKLEKLISSITGNDSELIYIPKNVKTVLKEVSSL